MMDVCQFEVCTPVRAGSVRHKARQRARDCGQNFRERHVVFWREFAEIAGFADDKVRQLLRRLLGLSQLSGGTVWPTAPVYSKGGLRERLSSG